MKYTILLYLFSILLFACSRESPSHDKLKSIEILNTINSEEIDLLNALSNQEINAFKIRPNHDILFSLGTLVHEANHKFHDIDNPTQINYRLNNNYHLKFKRHEVFGSKELIRSMPSTHIENFKDNHRYKLYIADTEGIENMSTQSNGLYGLLDEYNSYYQDMKTIVGLYTYIKEYYKCTDSEILVNYLGLYDDVMNSMSEFRYFTRAYISHAKNNQPKIYENIKNNQDLEEMLKYLKREENSLLRQYAVIQGEILENCKNYLEISNNAISVPGTDIGYRINQRANRSEMYDKLISELKTRDNK